MKTLITFLLILAMATVENGESIYDFKLNSIDGNEVELSEYRGNVLLIVNTASKCGYTPQYEGLQNIYEEYKDEGFYVLGFPSDNFGGQEFDTEEEIVEFCKVNFGVEFPLFSRTDVKGEDIHPLFEYLTSEQNPDFTGEIGWNFEKFLVDRDGNLQRRFKTQTAPDSDDVMNAIREVL